MIWGLFAKLWRSRFLISWAVVFDGLGFGGFAHFLGHFGGQHFGVSHQLFATVVPDCRNDGDHPQNEANGQENDGQGEENRGDKHRPGHEKHSGLFVKQEIQGRQQNG